MSGIHNEAYDHDTHGNGDSFTLNHLSPEATETPIAPSLLQPNGKRRQTTLDRFTNWRRRHQAHIRIALLAALNAVVIVFFGFATNHYVEKEKNGELQ
ncbi:AAEL004660-PA [Aedes aegypti]|uniref:AAEL004660-PA n=1 Tax=Aedes aegypti TaxID=7159 RepID=Q17C77_AEDAE|nr:AAEL004660-PA [Aedes aegypti]